MSNETRTGDQSATPETQQITDPGRLEEGLGGQPKRGENRLASLSRRLARWLARKIKQLFFLALIGIPLVVLVLESQGEANAAADWLKNYGYMYGLSASLEIPRSWSRSD
jgi:hypothetical protein